MSSNANNKEIPSIVKHMFYGEVLEDEIFPYPHFNENQVEMAKAMVNMKLTQSPRAYPSDLLKAKPAFR